jgi:hypothetical protein
VPRAEATSASEARAQPFAQAATLTLGEEPDFHPGDLSRQCPPLKAVVAQGTFAALHKAVV